MSEFAEIAEAAGAVDLIDDSPEHGGDGQEKKRRPRGPQILTLDQVLEMPDPNPLIQGFLAVGEFAMISQHDRAEPL